MDLLFKRYASPYLLVDEMILTAQFSDFVTEVQNIEQNDRIWEFYIHKVEGQSFEEFKGSLLVPQSKTFEMSKSDIETTVIKSFDILKDFIPNDI